MTNKKHLVTHFRCLLDSKHPRTADLIETLMRLYNSDEYQKKINEISAIEDKQKRNEKKRELLEAVCVAFILVGGGGKANITSPLPFIFIDIDGIGSLEEVLAKLNEIRQSVFGKNLVYSSLSISKKGIHLIFFLTESGKFDQYMQQLTINLRNMLNCEVDPQTNSPVCKIALAPFREYSVVNPDAVPLELQDGLRLVKVKKPAWILSKNLDGVLRELNDSGMAFKEHQRNAFAVKLAFSANNLGIPLSQVEEEMESRFSLSNFPDHLRTIRDIYRNNEGQHGSWKKSPNNLPEGRGERTNPINEAIIYLNEKFDLRYNEVLRCIEFKLKGGSKFLHAGDVEFNSIYIDLRKHNICIHVNDLRSLLFSDFADTYNPYKLFLQGLPEYDGQNYIGQLVKTLKITYPSEAMAETIITKWIVAMVGSMLGEADTVVVNHICLILQGAQSIGKTKWLLRFVDNSLRRYFHSGLIDPANKDSELLLATCFLIILDELETLKKSELAPLKEFITKENVNLRMPYARVKDHFDRKASFAGTVNESLFLNDSTGSRRFPVIEVESCDYEHKIDMKMVYAQGIHLYRSGYRHYFNLKESNEVSELNLRYQFTPKEEELLLQAYKKPEEGDYIEVKTVGEICQELVSRGFIRDYNNAFMQGVGRALAKHKFEKKKSGGKQSNVLGRVGGPPAEVQIAEGHTMEVLDFNMPGTTTSDFEEWMVMLKSDKIWDSIITPRDVRNN